jgi:hypothetical protein
VELGPEDWVVSITHLPPPIHEGRIYEGTMPVTLGICAGATIHFNSIQCERTFSRRDIFPIGV